MTGLPQRKKERNKLETRSNTVGCLKFFLILQNKIDVLGTQQALTTPTYFLDWDEMCTTDISHKILIFLINIIYYLMMNIYVSSLFFKITSASLRNPVTPRGTILLSSPLSLRPSPWTSAFIIPLEIPASHTSYWPSDRHTTPHTRGMSRSMK